MKNQIGNWTKALVLALMVLGSNVANAAVEDFQLSVRNVQQTAQNRLEFDVYLLDTDAGQPFELASVQLAFLINSQITTGALSATISNFGSGLLSYQQFVAVPAVVTPLTGYPGQTLIRLAAGMPVTAGLGTIISTSGDGTLLTHFIVTSTTDFVASSQPNLIFTSSTALSPLYPTRVAEFIATVSTQLAVIPLTNAIVDGNPLLNPPGPIQYDVTGGGSYCEGGSGVDVGLTDSESGVVYTLYRGATPLVPTVAGNGDPISFGLQTVAGTYTVSGTNAGGETLMSGNAIVSITPLPSVPTIPTPSASTICQGTPTTVFTTSATNATGYVWSVTGAGNSVAGTGTTGTVTWSPTFTGVATVSVYATGCGTSATASTTTTIRPTPTASIAGTTTVCQGTAAPNITFTNPQALPVTVTYNIGGSNEASINIGASTTATLPVSTSSSGSFAYNLVSVAYQTAPVCPNPITGAATVTVNPTPSVTDQSASITPGGTFTVTPAGTPAGTTYTWTVPTYTGGVSGGVAQATPVASITGTLTVPSGTGTAAYTVTPRTVTCIGSPFTLTVTVTSSCVPVVITADPVNESICAGGSATFSVTASGTTPAYQWQYNNGVTYENVVNGTPAGAVYTNATTATLGVSGVSAAGSYQYRCNATNCSVSSDQSNAATLTVNAIPSAPTVTLIQPDCGTATGTITVTSPTGAGMTYSINGSTYTNTTGVFPGVAPETYTVTARSSTACTSTGTPATINAQPPTPVVGNQALTIGTGTPFTVTPAGTPAGTTYTWTVPTYTGGVTGGVAQATPVASITGTLTVPSGTGTAIYTVTPRTVTCIGSPFILTVTVTSSCVPVVITADPVNESICAGGSATFSVTATGTTPAYQWQYNNGGTYENVVNGTPAGAVYTNATTATLGVSGVSAAGSYQYRCNTTNCSVSSDQSTVATLTVNAIPAQPAISADGPTTFCQGEDVVLSAPLSTSYLWSNGATTRTLTVTSSGSFSVQVTNPAGCQSVPSPTVVVTVNTLPSRPTITPAGSVTICAGSIQTLSSSTGISYLWSNGETTQSIDVNTTGSYTVQVTNILGCLSTASLVTSVTVNPTPSTPTITASGLTTFCAGGSVTLTSSVSSGYLWSTGATTQSIIVNSTGNYWVRVTDASGCQSAQSATTAVTVNPLPTAPTIGTITQPTCTVSTGSVVLGGLPAGNWTVNPGSITGSTPTVTVTGLAAGSRTYTVTNSNGCISPASVPVVINTQPAVPTVPVVVTVSQPTCAVSTGSVGFSGLPSTGIWTLTRMPGGASSTGTGTTTTITGISSGTYTFTVTNIAGCVSAATAPVIINAPLPVPSVPLQSVDCAGGFNHAVVTVTSPTGTGYQYQLDAGAFQTDALFPDVANGNHTITVRNASGCTATGTNFSINCGCTNPPLVVLAASSGSTCGVAAVTVSGNTFGGSATSVTISDNGGGAVTPASSSASPFSFAYTPTAADAGRTVVITVTTNNPLGTPCAAASATYALTVNANPAAPVPGTVTQPSCANPGGSVMLNNLPATGDWTIARTPGGATTTGSGTSTTITGLTAGTYTFTVTNSLGCISLASANVVINTQPDTPSAPVIGTITQPSCALSTGSVAISGLPATGTWTLTRSPGGIAVSGTGTTRNITGITSGTYTFTVANAAGCISPASEQVVIVTQPETPSAPAIGTITHPTCALATGSILLENMPATGEWTLTRYPGGITSTGTGTSATISTLGAGTYNFAVTNASGCTSPVSANAVINTQPPTPTAPVVGTVTHPTFTVATGSVVLSGLPSTGTWTLTRNPDGFTSQGTGTTRTVSGLEPGTYTFSVTNSVGCTSALTGDIVINARPGAPIVVINNPPNICSDQTTDLTLPAVTAGSDANLTLTYWTDAAATIPYATPATAPSGTYYIMGTSTAGYYTVKPVIVTADELPVANAGPDQILDYLFGTTLVADIPGIGTGIWELVSGTGDILNSVAPSTTVSGLSVGENVFSWTVTNGACDPVSDLITVEVNNLTIPTLITPNQDGANDYFVLQGLETLGRTELTVFDRRGLKVYENRDYDNSWEGLDYNSNPLPDDTYFWVVRSDNGVSLSGYIVVRR